MSSLEYWKNEFKNITNTDAVTNTDKVLGSRSSNIEKKIQQEPSLKELWNKLNYKEKEIILWDYDWIKVIPIYDNSQIAEEKTIKEYGGNFRGDLSDAFRHTLWQALNVQSVGNSFTRKWSNAHEYSTPLDQLKTDLVMDIHNNDIGIEIGLSNLKTSIGNLIDIIKTYITNGKMIILKEDKYLIKSNGEDILTEEIREYTTATKIAKEIQKNRENESVYH